MPLADLPDSLEELLDIWQAQNSFQTAIMSKIPGFQFAVPNSKGVKDRADILTDLVAELKDHSKVKILRIDDVVNDAKLAHDECKKFYSRVDSWRPPVNVVELRSEVDKLFDLYDRAMCKVESHIEALKKLRNDTKVADKADADKMKKRVQGCIARFFALLTTNNVPKFLARVIK